MMPLQVTALYAAILVLIYLFLAGRVVMMRRSNRIGSGSGDLPQLARAIRVHANFSEYVPLALLLLLLLEAGGLPRGLLHVLGGALVLGRILHVVGLSRSSGYSLGRFWGTVLTWLVLAFSALINLYYAFAYWLLAP